MQALRLLGGIRPEILEQAAADPREGRQCRGRTTGQHVCAHQHPEGVLVVGVVVQRGRCAQGGSGGITGGEAGLGGKHLHSGDQPGRCQPVGIGPPRLRLVGEQFAADQPEGGSGCGQGSRRTAGSQPGRSLVHPVGQFGEVQPVGTYGPPCIRPVEAPGAEGLDGVG